MTKPVNILKIVSDIGFTIEDDSSVHDASIDPSRMVISVNPDDPPERKFYSVAHELGHWFLHDRTVAYDRNTSNAHHNCSDEERAANLFAAELLMPYIEVKNDMVYKRYNPKDIARKYGVSVNAATIRYNNIFKTIF